MVATRERDCCAVCTRTRANKDVFTESSSTVRSCVHTEVQQTRPFLFGPAPNCQIGDTDTIWSLAIQLLFAQVWKPSFGICVPDLAIGAPHV